MSIRVVLFDVWGLIEAWLSSGGAAALRVCIGFL